MLRKLTLLTTITGFAALLFTFGCKKGCPTCKSYGYNAALQYPTYQVCLNNTCTCPNGFEGDSCQIYSINKYIQPSNNWIASDPCSGNPTYNVYMQTNLPYYTYFYMTNLFNSGAQVTAQIYSAANNQGTTLYIPQQQIGSIIVSGQGVYQTNGNLGKIILQLDYNQTGVDQQCTLTLIQTL